jgi:hypothetical protein
MSPADTNAIRSLLAEAAEHMAEAVKQAHFAYRYCPSAYTMAAMQSCLTAAKRLNRCRALAASLAAPPEAPAPEGETPPNLFSLPDRSPRAKLPRV